MAASFYTEYLIAAVVLEGEEQLGSTRSPDLAVEMSAMVGRRGTPLYQVVITALTSQRTVYKSCPYNSPFFANVEYARETGYWIPQEDFCLERAPERSAE